MRYHAGAASLIGGVQDYTGDVADPGELNFPALTVDARHRQSGAAGASERGVGHPDHLGGAERSRLAEDPDRLPGGFRGLEAVPQPVRHEHNGPSIGVVDCPGIAADFLTGQGNAHCPEIQAAERPPFGPRLRPESRHGRRTQPRQGMDVEKSREAGHRP